MPGFEGKKILGSHTFTPKDVAGPITFDVTRGDYSKLLDIVVQNLDKATVSLIHILLLWTYTCVSVYVWRGVWGGGGGEVNKVCVTVCAE